MAPPADFDKRKGDAKQAFNRAANPKPQQKAEPEEGKVRKPPQPIHIPKGPMAGLRLAVDKGVERRQDIQKAAEKEQKKIEKRSKNMLKSKFNEKSIGD